MKTILCSMVEKVTEEIKLFLNSTDKVCIIPWSFAIELNNEKFENEYFPIGGRRYNKYVPMLNSVGINDIFVANCYKHTIEEIIKKINISNVIILPGGNPEMLFNKLSKDGRLVDVLNRYNGLVIGESAGACIQFSKYLLTKENNFYGYQDFYEGIGRLNKDFYIDVHSLDDKEYLYNLSILDKDVYAIFNDGMMYIEDDKIKTFGKVKFIKKI